ncbi:hypothetical protein ACROYT_G020406 [Oculina patagonica]
MGKRHSIEVKRYGKIITYRADSGVEKQEEDKNVKIAIFSKPDKIILGGISKNKFDGCVFSAPVLFHWKTGLSKNVSVDIIKSYLKRDPRVHSAAVFVGACPNSESPGAGEYEIQECTRSNTNIFMTTTRGVIASPRPSETSYVRRCLWHVIAPSKHRLKFTLLFYNVSGVVPCSESEVVVIDGISSASAVLERFCYAKSNTVVYTRGHDMMVDMSLPESDFLDFIAVYKVVGLDEGPCPTNRSLTGMSGSLMSPNFPNNYEFEHECSWVISVPRGYHVLLSFNTADFHIHACNTSCACDFLEVRAGTTSEGKLIGKFCGSIPPSPIYVSGSDIWIRFVTNKLLNNKGFRASYKAINDLADECPWNKTFTAHRGYINSPRFALDYPGNMECIWRIHVPEKHRVSFKFLAPLNFDPNCTDFLEIRDGLHGSNPLLNRCCGSTAPPPNVFSSRREMFVRFKSDGYLRGQSDGSKSGFRATYFATRVKSGAAILKKSLFLAIFAREWALLTGSQFRGTQWETVRILSKASLCPLAGIIARGKHESCSNCSISAGRSSHGSRFGVLLMYKSSLLGRLREKRQEGHLCIIS